MEEYLSLEVLIMMLLMSFIENRNVNKNGKENKDEAGALAFPIPTSLTTIPFFNKKNKLTSTNSNLHYNINIHISYSN